MKNIKILARRSVLENKLKKLEKEQQQLEKQVEKLVEGCNHEIIIEIDGKLLSADGKRLYCLFCQEENPWMRKNMPKKMEKSTIIDTEFYFLTLMKNPEKKLERLYKQLKKKFPEDSEIQIAEKMKQNLDAEEKRRYEELW